MARPWEYADLRAIGEAWRMPTGTVAWVAIHQFLAQARRLSPLYGHVPPKGGVSPSGALGLAAAVHARLMPDLTAVLRAPCPHCGRRRDDTPQLKGSQE